MVNPVGSSLNQSIMQKSLEEAYSGAGAAVVGGAVIKPLICLKSIAQTSKFEGDFAVRRLMKKPSILYRGYGTFSLGFVTTTAIQTGTNEFLSEYSSNPLATAVVSGAFSSVFTGPTEGLQRQQEITGKNIKDTVSYMYKQKGPRAFFRGLSSTAGREGSFAGAYLGAAPALKEMAESHGFSEAQSRVLAGATAGAGAAIISHFFDTHKTIHQSNLFAGTSLGEVFRRRDFSGLGFRMGVVGLATTVLPFVKEKISKPNHKSHKKVLED